MFKKVLLATIIFVVASCTASISVKADPEIYVEPLEPNVISPEKDKNNFENYSVTRNPTQQSIRIPCDTEEYLKTLLDKEHGEKLLFEARGLIFGIPPGRPPQFAQPMGIDISVYVNQNTGTFTVAGTAGGYSCLIVNGTDFSPGGF